MASSAHKTQSPTMSHDVVITNPDIAVTLPSLKYGYRSTKLPWPELVHIIQVDGDLSKLSRSKEQQRTYEVFRHHLREQYVTATDYLLISKFGFEARPIKGKWEAHPRLADVTEPRTILVENDFPYYVEDNVKHYVLWKLKGQVTESELQSALLELKTSCTDLLHWTNPPSLQSVPDIYHVHILGRLLSTKEEPS